MRLSDRLEAVISFVVTGSRVADVGTDHGYVPIALVERRIAVSALAMDVREGPLARAADHIRQYGLEEKIVARLSDGVEGLEPGEADTVIMAGMGGELILHILREGVRLWNLVEHWILSPQSEPEKVRRYLQENGFAILREKMLCEDSKYYVIMDVSRGAMDPLTDAEAFYGPCLIRNRDPVLTEYLEREERVLTQIFTGLENQSSAGASARREEISGKLACIRQMLPVLQSGGNGPGKVQ